ncbi:RDD family protein [Rhodanobacter sp. DHG33]|uniref:RDD family protein n=1 Tax=Rhodanobacter sp. DHG33 TaxID=2775921 RepID=UPI0017800531|nr:RDD family protein [Rhodanobacter sp. DHG33]MBD8899613.1 RDD family protein [Rhodanobacter sp. DHG33]
MEIWIGRNGERHGPYKEEDVRAWLRSGQVSGSDLAWREGLADWQPLSVLYPDATPATTQATGGSYPPPPAAAPGFPQTTAASLEDYAGFWKRVAAYILDAIILWIPQMLVESVTGASAAKKVMNDAIQSAAGDMQAIHEAQVHYFVAAWPAMLIGLVIAVLYFGFCESSAWQGTVGKLALGIRVTDLDGRRISLGRAIGRYFGKLLSAIILCIGFIMVAFTQRKQGLHDIICNTLVLNGRASEFKDATTKPTGNGGSFNA